MISLNPEQAALKLAQATGLVTFAKFLKASDYKKNPLGNIRIYSIQQGNVYLRRMTNGQRTWGHRVIASPDFRSNKRTPVIQHMKDGKKQFYLSLTLPTIVKERTVYVDDVVATDEQLHELEPFKKQRRRNRVICVDDKVREFRDIAIEPGATFHFNHEEIKIGY